MYITSNAITNDYCVIRAHNDFTYLYCHMAVLSTVNRARGACNQLVSFPDPTTHARKGSGDIGADSWFCKLSNHVIICIGFLLAHMRSRDGAQDQEDAPMSPDPFPRERLGPGSGNETSNQQARGAAGSLGRQNPAETRMF